MTHHRRGKKAGGVKRKRNRNREKNGCTVNIVDDGAQPDMHKT